MIVIVILGVVVIGSITAAVYYGAENQRLASDLDGRKMFISALRNHVESDRLAIMEMQRELDALRLSIDSTTPIIAACPTEPIADTKPAPRNRATKKAN
jgi:hypothetical protein